jgi:hypothetical protein
MRWLIATGAPWALGATLLVSFTAVASNDPQGGISAAALFPGARPSEAGALVPPSALLTGAAPRLPGLGLDGMVREARLNFDPPSQPDPALMGVPPRPDLKAMINGYPSIDRSRKGDPLIALRPSLSRRGLEIVQGQGSPEQRLMSVHADSIVAVLTPGRASPPDGETAPAFEPWPEGNPGTTTQQASSVQSPAAAAAGSTGAARGPRGSVDGATPTVSRALVLSSTTPAPADATPIEIAAAPVSAPQGAPAKPAMTAVPRLDPTKPNYAELIDPDKLGREQRCLAEAVYFEARSEPEEGQAAVAQVVLNRVRSGLYPSSVCGVVYQNRHRHLACQFTFACEGKSLRTSDTESWETAKRVAREVMEGKTYLSEVGGATHYHADYVRPYWARRLKKMDVIGRHIFYKLKPGQT